MLVYRVFPYLANATSPDDPGHPMYLHRPQVGGRWDNPVHYDTWYFARTPECAVGETFAKLDSWSEDMFDFPALPGSRRALGVFDLPDDLPLLDLDDPETLLRRGLRPSGVVSLNRGYTQGVALALHDERLPHGPRRWSGVQWWSLWRPFWEVLAVWVPASEHAPHEVVKIDALDTRHPAVASAAKTLRRPIDLT
jgi:hypothetical protein